MTSSHPSVRGLMLTVALTVSVLVSGTAYAKAAEAKAAEAKAAETKAVEATGAADNQDLAGDEDARKAAMDAAKAEALALLEEMSGFLAEQKSFGARSEISYDVVQPRGLRLEFGSDSQMWLRRPNRLRVERHGREGETRTFRYDGKQISLLFDDEAAYVQVEYEGSIDEMLGYVVDELGMPMPLSDLFDTKFYANVVDRIGLAAVVGQSRIAGQQCVQAVYRAEDVDFQIWIAAEGDPLPCRIVITYKKRRGEPTFRAELSDWQLGIKIPDDRFEFEPPKDAERLRVRAFSTKGEK